MPNYKEAAQFLALLERQRATVLERQLKTERAEHARVVAEIERDLDTIESKWQNTKRSHVHRLATQQDSYIKIDPLIEFRATGATRKLAGYVVPWNESVTVHGQTEVFRRGAFDEWFDRYPVGGSQAKRVALNLEHNRKMPIGLMTATENRAAGQYAEFKLANTDSAREAAQLVTDGVLGGFSIEFKRAAPPAADGSITKADLIGVGVVACPVYDGATLTRAYHRTRLEQSQAKTRAVKLRLAKDKLRRELREQTQRPG